MTPRPLTPEERAGIEQVLTERRLLDPDCLYDDWREEARVFFAEAYWRERAERLAKMLLDIEGEAAGWQVTPSTRAVLGRIYELTRRAALAEQPPAALAEKPKP